MTSATISMTDRNILIGMLRQGQTGDQVLQILDLVATDFFNQSQDADASLVAADEVLADDVVLV
jgi:hypothetical protein